MTTLPQQAQSDTTHTEPCTANAMAGEPRTGELRDARRVQLNVGVGFRGDSSFYTGFATDISEGGLFVASHMLQPIGSQLTLTFALPTGSEISVRAIVRWLRAANGSSASPPPGMGVQFQGLTPQTRARVGELVAQRAAMFFAS